MAAWLIFFIFTWFGRGEHGRLAHFLHLHGLGEVVMAAWSNLSHGQPVHLRKTINGAPPMLRVLSSLLGVIFSDAKSNKKST